MTHVKVKEKGEMRFYPLTNKSKKPFVVHVFIDISFISIMRLRFPKN